MYLSGRNQIYPDSFVTSPDTRPILCNTHHHWWFNWNWSKTCWWQVQISMQPRGNRSFLNTEGMGKSHWGWALARWTPVQATDDLPTSAQAKSLQIKENKAGTEHLGIFWYHDYLATASLCSLSQQGQPASTVRCLRHQQKTWGTCSRAGLSLKLDISPLMMMDTILHIHSSLFLL